MLLNNKEPQKKSVLAVGPHPDDVELGCFGTLARLASEGFTINILLLSKGSLKEGQRIEEARESAEIIKANFFVEDLEDGNILDNYKTVDIIRKYIDMIKPGILFSPPLKDGHQDHKNVAQAIIAAIKDVKEVYFYETPKSFDFSPRLYVDISNFIELKLKAMLFHKSQIKNEEIIREAIISASKYHGFKINQSGKHFEAFDVFRVIF